MKIAKTAFATLVAVGLVAAPLAAQAAEARQSSPVSQDEKLVGGSLLLYLGLIGAAAAMVLLLSNDNSSDIDGLPASP